MIVIGVTCLIIIVLDRIAHERGQAHEHGPTILDTGHAFIPQMDVGVTGDVLVAATIVPLLMSLKSLLVATNAFLIVMLIRGVANTLTILPSTDRHRCEAAQWIAGPKCHGHHISGHFTFAAAFLIVAVAAGRLPWWVASVWAAVIAFFILAERRHYSTDVFVAGVLTILVLASGWSLI